MSLSADLISQFVQVTKPKETKTEETTVYGVAKVQNGSYYVQFDGSELLTPMITTSEVADGERIAVMIKNHKAICLGNVDSPAARLGTVNEMGTYLESLIIGKADIGELTAMTGKIVELEAGYAEIGDLKAGYAEIGVLKSEVGEFKSLTANEIMAINGRFDTLDTIYLSAQKADITYAKIGVLDAANAEIESLKTSKLDANSADIRYAKIADLEATNARFENLDIKYLSVDQADLKYATIGGLNAATADIETLRTTKLDATSADVKYANIDFSNIGKAAMEYFYAQSGLIQNVTVGDAKITGELVGVTIKGDLIEAGTLKADKLVVKGSDGIFYKLNIEGGTIKDGEAVPEDSLHGSVITAKSIVAEQIAVDDLVAFDATIGGFKIGNTSIYSGVKESVGNTTRGIYLDNDGQIAFGDSLNYVKFFKDTDGQYKLDIQASKMHLGLSGIDIESTVLDTKYVADTTAENADISGSQTGTSLHITDSADANLLGYTLYGKSKKSANLLDITATSGTVSGVKFTINKDKSITLEGTPTADIYFKVSTIELTAGTYILSCTNATSWNGCILYCDRFATWTSNSSQNVLTITETTSLTFSLYVKPGADRSRTVYPMLNPGDIVQPYEPYFEGIKSVGDSGSVKTTITGANLINLPDKTTTTATYVYNKVDIGNIPAGTYTFSCNHNIPDNIGWWVNFYDENSNTIGKSGTLGNYVNSVTITFTSNVKYVTMYVNSAVTMSNVMLNEGSTALPYEPYTSQSIVHTLTEPLRGIGDVRDEIGDARGKRITRIGTLVLKGDEPYWNATYTSVGYTYYDLSNKTFDRISPETLNYQCSHFVPSTTLKDGDTPLIGKVKSYGNALAFCYDGTNTNMEAFKAWLAEQYENGTPVTVQYIRTTPIETDLTDEEMAKFHSMRTYESVTNISTDDICDVSAEYVRNTELAMKVLNVAGAVMFSSTQNTDDAAQKALAQWAHANDKTLIDGGKIYTKTISASHLNLNDYSETGALLGGLTLTGSSIYSNSKNAIDSTEQGLYLDSAGQMNLGNANNYLKFAGGVLDIKANSVRMLAPGNVNLLTDSYNTQSNKSYNCAKFTPKDPLVPGETYTATLCVTPAAGVTYLNILVSSGYRFICQFKTSGTSTQTIKTTFTLGAYTDGRTPTDNIQHAQLWLYRYPNDSTVTGTTTVHWLKVVNGNVDTSLADVVESSSNYLEFSNAGLMIGDLTSSTLKNNVLIDNDSVDIRNGTTTLASFEASKIKLGIAGQDSTLIFNPRFDDDELGLLRIGPGISPWDGVAANFTTDGTFNFWSPEGFTSHSYWDNGNEFGTLDMEMSVFAKTGAAGTVNPHISFYVDKGNIASGNITHDQLVDIDAINGVSFDVSSLSFKIGSYTAYRPYYCKGDSFSFTKDNPLSTGGYISSSNKTVYFVVPLSKPVIGSPTVTVTTVSGFKIRQDAVYQYGSGASVYVSPASYKAAVIGDGNAIMVHATFGNTTNTSNNSPCGIEASIKITFS